jgi:hypothetical protein
VERGSGTSCASSCGEWFFCAFFDFKDQRAHGTWDLGLGAWVLGLGSWVLDLGPYWIDPALRGIRC